MTKDLLTPAVRRRLIGTLFAANTTFMGAQITAFTLMSIIGADLGGSDAAAGIPSTVSMIGRAAAGYPIGWLMDRLGRRAGLTVGYMLGVLSGIICVLAIGNSSLIGFCVGVALSGMARGTSEQSRYIAAEAEVPERRAKAIGFIVAGGTIAAIAGPLLVDPASNLVTSFGLSLFTGPYIASGLLSLICVLLVFFLLRPDPLQVGKAIEAAYNLAHNLTTNTERGRTFRQVLAEPSVCLAMAALLIGQFVMTFLMVIMPVHMHHHDHSTGAISWVIALHSVGMYAVSPLTSRLIDRMGRTNVIILGSLTLAVSALVTPIAPTFVPIAVAMFLVGVGWNFAFIAGSSLLSDALTQNERGRIQGASETVIAVAGGAGSLSSGLVFSASGVAGLSAVGLISSFILLAAAMVWGRVTPVATVAGD